ncbi:MAG: sulfotransferase [Phormidesmis sp.]
MSLVDFLIIGVPKAGTTSLYAYLDQHPNIYTSPNKEPHYFAFSETPPVYNGPGDDNAWLSQRSVYDLDAYRTLFSEATDNQVKGEASVMYLHLSESRDRIAALVPDVKLVVILRNPIERAYAHYRHMRRDGREWQSFEQALKLEDSRKEHGWSPVWHYRSVGYYYQQLSYFLERFDRAQLKVCLFEDLVASPQAVLADIFSFIGVDSRCAIDTSKRHNASPAGRGNRALHDFLTQPNRFKQTFKKIIPPQLRKPLSLKVYRLNQKKLPPLSNDTRRLLVEAYRSDIQKLESLIDRDLSNWLA